MNILLYILLAFLGGVSFGIPASFVKLAYASGFQTADVVGAQFFFGALILWLVGIFTKKIALSFREISKLLLAGIPMTLTTLFYYHSLNYLDASIAIIVLFQFTWMGVLVEAILEGRRPSTGKVLSVICLFIGSLLAVNIISTPIKEAIPLQGVLWGLLAAASFTAFIFISGKVSTHVHPVTKSIYMATGAFLISLLIYPPLFLINGSLTGEFFTYGLVYGLFGVALPPFLFSISLPRLDSGLGTILSASELPSSVIMSMIILSEHVSLSQWSGIVVILFGMALPSLMLAYSRRGVPS